MTSQHTKSNIISSLFWKLMERGAAQGIQLAVQIVLARVLAPEQFGTIAIVMVFVNLAQVFVQSGFSMALIQKKDADSEDFSSVFYLSLAVAGVSYVIIFICAPYIAKFYAMPVLEPVLRVLALNLFAGAFNSVQNAFVARLATSRLLSHCKSLLRRYEILEQRACALQLSGTSNLPATVGCTADCIFVAPYSAKRLHAQAGSLSGTTGRTANYCLLAAT